MSLITVFTFFVHGKFQKIILFRLADPASTQDQGCHLDRMCLLFLCHMHVPAKGHARSNGVGWKIPTNKLLYCKLKILFENKLQNTKP